MTTHREILANDHLIVGAGLRSLIEDLQDHEVIAEAEDGRQAIELVEKHQPDVLVLDINMPRMDGLPAPRTATPELPLTPRQVEILRRVVQGRSMKEIAYKNRIATHPRAAAIQR